VAGIAGTLPTDPPTWEGGCRLPRRRRRANLRERPPSRGDRWWRPLTAT